MRYVPDPAASRAVRQRFAREGARELAFSMVEANLGFPERSARGRHGLDGARGGKRSERCLAIAGVVLDHRFEGETRVRDETANRARHRWRERSRARHE